MPTLSIDMTDQQADRVKLAIGAVLGLGRAATNTEARSWLVDRIKEIVLKQEKKMAEEAIMLISPIDLI
jgi:hypothetical protein